MKKGERGRDILLNKMCYVHVYKQKNKVCVTTFLIFLFFPIFLILVMPVNHIYLVLKDVIVFYNCILSW